jgi:hypothetical protein
MTYQRRTTGLYSIPWPEHLSLTEQAAVVDAMTGEVVGLVLADTPADAPHDVREGVTVRRLAALQGCCPACGARLVLGTRRERRRAAAVARAPVGVPHLPHLPTCPGHDLVLDAAIARWQQQEGGR